jgi:uncharacterized protein YjiS (DUF1127 family)
MGPFTALMTVDHTEAGHADRQTSSGTSFGGRIVKLIQFLRAEAAKRRLRDQLAEMDNAMLMDIGMADDEIHMIRSRQNFTPRAWANRSTF